MQPLNLPDFECDIQQNNGFTTIFDGLRKKYVVLTPEEWVRQNFVNYMVTHLKYPKSLIKLEKGHAFNTLKKRSDIIVYDREGAAFMLIECKASHVKIEQKVFVQASVYNKTVKAKYLVITNGMQHFCCRIDREANSYKFMDELPVFE
jgi:hypothetical protein